MERIFATKEEGIPWRVRQETIYENGVTLEGWFALWQKYFSLKPTEAFESLFYIGYCGKMRDAVTIYPFKLTEALKHSKRKVFNIYLVGLHGTEVIMDAFIKNHDGARDFIAAGERSVVNYFREAGKYLIVSYYNITFLAF